MPKYEYIRIRLDVGDLAELNRLGSTGWHVVAVVPRVAVYQVWALLERLVP